MESNDGLFMPKKVKRPSELIRELNQEAERKKESKEKTVITPVATPLTKVAFVNIEQDNDRERRKLLNEHRNSRWNTHIQSIDTALFKQNVVAISQLAAYLYLDSTTVIQYCFYWLGEYNNKQAEQDVLFKDIIHGILSNLPVLEISGHYGRKYTSDTRSSYCMLFRFAGSELHQVPHVHFTQRNAMSNPDRENPAILKGFAYALNPLNKCFLNLYGAGMRAELRADTFVYNTVLEEFYEPSFIILTCFMLDLNYQRKMFTYHLFAGKTVRKSDVAEMELELSHKRADLIQAYVKVLEDYVNANLEDNGEEGTKVKQCISTTGLPNDCIDPNDKDAFSKRERLLYDLVKLIIAIRENRHDIEKLYQTVAQQWQEKSLYCASEMAIRFSRVVEQL